MIAAELDMAFDTPPTRAIEGEHDAPWVATKGNDGYCCWLQKECDDVGGALGRCGAIDEPVGTVVKGVS